MRSDRQIAINYFRREYGEYGEANPDMVAEAVDELSAEQLAAIVGSVEDMPWLAPCADGHDGATCRLCGLGWSFTA